MMEDNVADALKMAADVLLFVVALTISISSFTQARITADTIFESTDPEYVQSYVEESDTTERIVGVESILPVISRSFKENYKIYFYLDRNRTNPMLLYTKKMADGTQQEINFIDLKRSDIVVFGNDSERQDFVMALLYGNKINTDYGKSFNQISQSFYKNSKITLNSEGLYDKIKNNRYIEYIGEYYQEDEVINNIENDSESPDANKTVKRIYTYALY